jgi:hypothetical protein
VQWGFGTLAMGSQLPFAAVDPNVCFADKPVVYLLITKTALRALR